MKRQFHVYIIESPNAPDMYLKRFEGESLGKTLRLSNISTSHRLAVNKEAFTAAFLVGLKNHFKDNNVPPIIHISAHGDSDGIQLTSGERVNWEELKGLLFPVNTILKGSLLVCMSSCEGYSGCRMAMIDDNFPFMNIIGSTGKPTWGETNIAYATFYHLFSRGEDIFKCVSAMKIASGNQSFSVEYSIFARKKYLDALRTYVQPINQTNAISVMEDAIPKNQNEITKALREILQRPSQR